MFVVDCRRGMEAGRYIISCRTIFSICTLISIFLFNRALDSLSLPLKTLNISWHSLFWKVKYTRSTILIYFKKFNLILHLSRLSANITQNCRIERNTKQRNTKHTTQHSSIFNGIWIKPEDVLWIGRGLHFFYEFLCLR